MYVPEALKAMIGNYSKLWKNFIFFGVALLRNSNPITMRT